MADIDIGAAAIDRGGLGGANRTRIGLDNPANDTGTIVTFEVWAFGDLTGFRAGTFYFVSGTDYKCRDSEAIGNVTSGSKQTFSGLSCNVVTGDYAGTYHSSGSLERDLSGFAGVYWVTGEYIDPDDQTTYALGEGDALSLYGESAAGAPVTVTPPTLSLAITLYAPIIGLKVIPSTLALTITTYAPSVYAGPTVIPSTLALILTTYAPSIDISDNKLITPSTLALTLTTYAPIVTATGDITVTPSTLALILTLYAPSITVSDNILVTPSVLALVLTAYAPTLIIPGLLRVVRVITSQYRDVASITSQKRIAKAITSTKRKVRVITSGG